MAKSVIGRFARIVREAGLAPVVLLMAAASSGGVSAASNVAGAGAEVVAPIAVAEADTQLRFQSASGAGRLTTRAGATLIHTVIVRDLDEDDAISEIIARAARRVSVTLAYD